MSDALGLQGGPAFPVSIPGVGDNGCAGMSLRDWFAGQALTGLAAAIQGPGCADWQYYSTAAYAIADAMVTERGQS